MKIGPALGGPTLTLPSSAPSPSPVSAVSRWLQRDLIIADNFYEDPASVVRYAYSLEYMFPYDPPDALEKGQRVAWRTSRWRPSRECPFKSSEGLIEKLEFLTGEELDREHWDLEFPVDERGYPAPGYLEKRRGCWWNCSFHIKHHDQALGEGVHSHTDRDIWSAVGDDGWVGLIYLNEDAPPRGGLHTWRNIDPAHQGDWMTPKENWILIDALGNIYNRLLLHRGRTPHSGAAGWGETMEAGRLYQTIFFRTLGPRRTRPLRRAELGI